ncbi:zinc finger domain-containing protein [Candidatus Parvarchaeota archaeon]|nr:zinc finger domain-containing protein [Candidatus Parvarchaeota archaeon]
MVDKEMQESVVNFCISCGRSISGVKDSVIFPCPNCGNKIFRCGKCRIKGSEYTCQVCGFVGP